MGGIDAQPSSKQCPSRYLGRQLLTRSKLSVMQGVFNWPHWYTPKGKLGQPEALTGKCQKPFFSLVIKKTQTHRNTYWSPHFRDIWIAPQYSVLDVTLNRFCNVLLETFLFPEGSGPRSQTRINFILLLHPFAQRWQLFCCLSSWLDARQADIPRQVFNTVSTRHWSFFNNAFLLFQTLKIAF